MEYLLTSYNAWLKMLVTENHKDYNSFARPWYTVFCAVLNGATISLLYYFYEKLPDFMHVLGPNGLALVLLLLAHGAASFLYRVDDYGEPRWFPLKLCWPIGTLAWTAENLLFVFVALNWTFNLVH